MLTIRRAVPADIPALLSLLRQVEAIHAKGRPDIFKTPTPDAPLEKYTVDQLGDMIADDNNPIFAADDDGSVLGYAFCEIKQYPDDNILTPIKTLYIDDLCVDAAARGKHIGESLYRYVLDYAKSIGCHNVTLRVWNFEGSATGFYEKMGLKVQATIMEQIL